MTPTLAHVREILTAAGFGEAGGAVGFCAYNATTAGAWVGHRVPENDPNRYVEQGERSVRWTRRYADALRACYVVENVGTDLRITAREAVR